MEVAGMEYDQESISFSRNEWRHLLDEIEMRGVKNISQCINNAWYLSKLDRAEEQSKRGEGIVFTENGWNGYNSWLDINEDTFDRITNMIRDIKNNVIFENGAMPEKLENAANTYSLKIDEDNELIYIAGTRNFTVTSCKGHH